jgi:hypothetical protein
MRVPIYISDQATIGRRAARVETARSHEKRASHTGGRGPQGP